MPGGIKLAIPTLRWFCGWLLLVPLLGAAAQPATAASDYRRLEQHLQVPDAILADASGKSFSLAQELAADGPVALNFITPDCGPQCAGALRLFADLQAQQPPKGKSLRLISIVLNPNHVSPARLRSFARELGAGKGWMVLTGFGRELNPVVQAFGPEALASRSSITFLHAGPHSAWVRIDGPLSPADLLAELR